MNPHATTHGAGERGWVLVTSISLLMIMMIIALASVALVDTQQTRSREQRERESSLNLAEGVLYAQGFKLAQRWPNPATPASDCTTGVGGPNCPAAADLARNLKNVDTDSLSTTWTTRIRDNGGNLAAAFQPQFANATQTGQLPNGTSYTCTGPCTYDANGDRMMWVEAGADVRGERRTVVATLKLERLPESTPRSAVVAGGINTGSSGSQVKVYAPGSQVIVRCPNTSQNTCVSPNQNGIEPDATTGDPGNLMTPTQIERFKQRAINDGTYSAGCPVDPATGRYNFSGAVRFVENCNTPNLANGSYFTEPCPNPPGLPPKPPGSGGNGMQTPCINTIHKPGLLIWRCGSMDISGHGTFVGIMYFANGSDGSCTPRGTNPPDCSQKNHNPNSVFTTSGGFGIWGALAVDGNGCVTLSSNGLQVRYDSNVFDAVASYGTVGLVQDTWREMVPN